jgi:hypothetical protein
MDELSFFLADEMVVQLVLSEYQTRPILIIGVPYFPTRGMTTFLACL